jgi:hypothetical protein
MPTFNITSPDGKKYRVSGDNAQGAHAALMKMLGEDVGVVEDSLKSLGSGAVRGGIGLAALPEMAARGVARLGQEGLQAVGLADDDYNIPVLDTATGRALSGLTSLDDYEAKTTAGRYAGTIGEFAGGAGAFGAAGKAAKIAGKALAKNRSTLPALADDVPITTTQQAIGEGLEKVGQRVQDLGVGKGLGGALQTGKTSVVAGSGSELAGQMTEGTAAEPYARVIGAFLAPVAATGAKNKTLAAFQKRAMEKPALETARDASRVSYKAFDDAVAKATDGGKFINMSDVVKKVEDSAFSGEGERLFMAYTPRLAGSEYVDAARQAIIKHTGKKFNLAQLDSLRSGLGDLHRKSGYDPRVGFLKDQIDDVIMKTPVDNINPNNLPIKFGSTPSTKRETLESLIKAARSDYRRLKKVELFEEVMGTAGKAELTAAAQGAGGNIVNSYRQAAKQILQNKRMRDQFDDPELEMMEAFVMGRLSDNALRLIGKLSPTGNGLMQALNIAAIATNPAFIVGTAAGFGAKAAGDALAKSTVNRIRETIMLGAKPKQKINITDQDIRQLIGSAASIEGG